MKLVGVVVLCACHSSTPPAEPVPLPPSEAEQAAAAAHQDAGVPQDISKWTAFPALAAPPVSHPTGDPIKLPAYAPKPGDAYREDVTTSFEQHYQYAAGTRFQRTDRKFDVDVRVLAAETDHPTKVEISVTTAHETVALANEPTTTPREDLDLLVGTYIVSPGPGGGFERDEAVVTRGGGLKVYGREQEELGSMFGTTLREGHAIARVVRSKSLRVGEVVPLGEADKRMVAGSEPIAGAFTLMLTAADARTVTYQLDVVASVTTDGATTDIRATGTLTFDRATGRVIDEHNQMHKLQKHADTTEDVFDMQHVVTTHH